MTGALPLALVVQRYGPDVVGGAESLCHSVAQMLAPHRPVEVLTTCAKDYVTWRNEYPAGEDRLDGIPVRRFPVDFERTGAFHRAFGRMLGGLPLDGYPQHKAAMRALVARGGLAQQEEFVRLQGPHSTALLNHLASCQDRYAGFVFFTYLYSPTYFGAQLVPKNRAVLIPTAHDEVTIFVPAYRRLFESVGAFIFLTPEERQFVLTTFGVKRARHATIGMPVSLRTSPDAEAFRAKYHVDGPFLLYAGRVDPSKGCDRLFRYYQQSRKAGAHDLPLILIGDRAMTIPADRGIRYLGRVSEEDKVSALSAAAVVINPSPFESFSIVTLEAMAAGSPVLVNGQCEVLKGHIVRSSAGLYYEGYAEFVEALRFFLENAFLRGRMGENGRRYVEQNYNRDAIESRYLRFLEAFELARA